MRINFRPIGRLGNVMFQAAATLGYAKKHRCEWGFPDDMKEVPYFHQIFPNLPIVNGGFARYNRTDPSQFGYEEMPRFKQDTTLCGFFQSQKYFEHCQEDVKNIFKLDIKPVDSVSIHVRRGDYVQYSNSFPPINEEYIYDAMGKFCIGLGYKKFEGINARKFIFFSDDIQWCKDFVSKGFQFMDKMERGILHHVKNEDLTIQFSEGKTEFEDLSLMASCSHHIIANSTFSWWGAFLGHNPDKIIVSPHYENWFGPGFTGSAPKDLIPPEWHQIKFR